MLSLVLVAPQLSAGSLVRPFGPSLPGRTYHLLQAPSPAPRPAVEAVAAWIDHELQTLAYVPAREVQDGPGAP